MTTDNTNVSVQPTTSEPNEREAFEQLWIECQFIDDPSKCFSDLVYQALKHQQSRIDFLEDKIVTIKDINSVLAKQDAKTIESLQAQLKLAMDALGEIDRNDKHYFSYKYARTQARRTLAEIKKIGAQSEP